MDTFTESLTVVAKLSLPPHASINIHQQTTPTQHMVIQSSGCPGQDRASKTKQKTKILTLKLAQTHAFRC
eukprot:1367175-Amorphochlora_amoeboformis.AAC.1